MKIAITGASGLIGSALMEALKEKGIEVITLVRSKENLSDAVVYWSPTTGEIEKEKLEGVDVVVNLAGENIASGRWTAGRKKRIRDSRVLGTENLCRVLASLKAKPKVLLNASAVGYYGDCGEEILTEDGSPGRGFLASVCQQWEKATKPAADAGIRVVKMRFGIVLSLQGGALKRMLTPFKLGVGGKIGSGDQFMSWITLDDLLRVMMFAMDDERVEGAVNVVAPETVRNVTFTKTLGRQLNRPTIMSVPAFILRMFLGEMAEEMLLNSSRVYPHKLQELGFEFRHKTLDEALRFLLDTKK